MNQQPMNPQLTVIEDLVEPTIEAEEPPVDEPLVDELPADEPLVDELLADEALVDELPADELTADELPVDELADELPADEVPADELPVDELPADELTVEDPVTEEHTVEEHAVEKPSLEESTAEEPAVEEAIVEDPISEELAVEEHTVEEHIVRELNVEEPALEEPTMEDLTVGQPAAVPDLVAAETPVNEEPVVVEDSIIEESTIGESTAAVADQTVVEESAVEETEELAVVEEAIIESSAIQDSVELNEVEEPTIKETSTEETSEGVALEEFALVGVSVKELNADQVPSVVDGVEGHAAEEPVIGESSLIEPVIEEPTSVVDYAVFDESIAREPVAKSQPTTTEEVDAVGESVTIEELVVEDSVITEGLSDQDQGTSVDILIAAVGEVGDVKELDVVEESVKMGETTLVEDSILVEESLEQLATEEPTTFDVSATADLSTADDPVVQDPITAGASGPIDVSVDEPAFEELAAAKEPADEEATHMESTEILTDKPAAVELALNEVTVTEYSHAPRPTVEELIQRYNISEEPCVEKEVTAEDVTTDPIALESVKSVQPLVGEATEGILITEKAESSQREHITQQPPASIEAELEPTKFPDLEKPVKALQLEQTNFTATALTSATVLVAAGSTMTLGVANDDTNTPETESRQVQVANEPHCTIPVVTNDSGEETNTVLDAEREVVEKSDIANGETSGEVVEIAQSISEEQLTKNAKVSLPDSLAASPIDTVFQSSLSQGTEGTFVTDPMIPTAEEEIHPAFRKREILVNDEPNARLKEQLLTSDALQNAEAVAVVVETGASAVVSESTDVSGAQFESKLGSAPTAAQDLLGSAQNEKLSKIQGPPTADPETDPDLRVLVGEGEALLRHLQNHTSTLQLVAEPPESSKDTEETPDQVDEETYEIEADPAPRRLTGGHEGLLGRFEISRSSLHLLSKFEAPRHSLVESGIRSTEESSNPGPSTATDVATKLADGPSESNAAKNTTTEDDGDRQSTAERSINSVTSTKRSNWLKILWRSVFNSLFGRLLAPFRRRGKNSQ